MRISLQQPLNVGVIKGIVSLVKNDDFKACDSIRKFSIFWVVMGLREDFTVKTSKSHSNDKHHKTS